MTQNQQRFSGPELAALLAQVREQLGDDASILEANRLRQGGIGGFFSKERFEVVAVPADLDPLASRPSGAVAAKLRADPTERGAGGHLDGLLSRAERVSSVERHTARLGGDPAPAAGRLALDELRTSDATFQHILQTALADADIDLDAEDLLAPPPPPPPRHSLAELGTPPVPPAPPRPSAGPAEDAPRPPIPHIPPAPIPVVEPPAPGPVPSSVPASPSSVATPPLPASPSSVATPPPASAAAPSSPAPVPAAAAVSPPVAVLVAPVDGRRRPRPEHTPTARDLTALPAGGFWSRLLRFEQLIDDGPLHGGITAVVGRLDDALAVGRAVARANDVDPADVVVVTQQGPVADLPPWFVVRTGDEVAERACYWRKVQRDAVVVIDADADADGGLDHIRGALTAAGPDVTRLAVSTLDDTPGLAALVGAIGPVAALDLTRPPSADQLLRLVERGVRVATVCGRPLTPLLLAALAAPTDRG